jgi:hypothetical protein
MNKTGTRLSIAFRGSFILIILLLTLNPFYLTRPARIYFTLDSDFNNWVANILLFLPIGFFYRMAAAKRRGAFLLGAVISLSIETIQLFIPARTPSVVDIIANAMGSGLGAILNDVISTRISISQGMIGRLRLETPLMGLIYLMGPLLWVNSLTLGNSPDRWILTTLIGICGAIVLSELFRHWWETTSYRISGYASIAAGIWFFIGASFALQRSTFIIVIGFGIMLLTGLLTLRPRRSTERRFERTTLSRLAPFFTLYLILSVLWRPTRPLTGWHWSIGFTNLITETSLRILAPRIEYLVAFTVLGYIIAEWNGRSEIPLRKGLPRLFLYTAGASLTLEFIAGFQVGPGASLIRAAMVILSALFGGLIYHLLREHIRYLLKH